VVTGERDVLGYYSWGSNDPEIRRRHFDLTFVPGALAAMFVSTDGRTFTEPPESWDVGTWKDPKSHYADSPQSLAGDLIRDGVTGVAAHVAEPYLDATVRPDVLFPAYVSGLNLAEAFYAAIPFLSWQTVVIGDPLCAPFRTKPAAEVQLDPGIDQATELPRFFSARRLHQLTRPGWNTEAVSLVARAESQLGRNDSLGARRSLEQAVALDSRIDGAHRALGLLYDSAGESAKAVEQYKAVIAIAPNDLLVLNNLAYTLATKLNKTDEALRFAERAYKLGSSSAAVVDTLAWVRHLTGDDAEAARLFDLATRHETGVADIHLHASIVFAAVRRPDDARRELGRALQISPDLLKTDDVARLQRELNASK